MAAQKGRLMVLKIGDGAGSETFTTIGGLRSNTITINNEEVDITNKDSAGWKELLENAGVKSVSMSASGVFKDDAQIDLVNTRMIAGTIGNFQLVLSNGDYYQGAFQINSFERTGEYNGAEMFSISLTSSGAVAFTAA